MEVSQSKEAGGAPCLRNMRQRVASMTTKQKWSQVWSQVRQEWSKLQAQWPVLVGWTLLYNQRFRLKLGRCRYSTRTIEIAQWLLAEQPLEQVLHTLRHEAAHVLAGKGAAHGIRWQEWARKLGVEPRARCSKISYEQTPAGRRPAPWQIRCGRCGFTRPRLQRLKKNAIYMHIGCGGKFTLETIKRRGNA